MQIQVRRFFACVLAIHSILVFGCDDSERPVLHNGLGLDAHLSGSRMGGDDAFIEPDVPVSVVDGSWVDGPRPRNGALVSINTENGTSTFVEH